MREGFTDEVLHRSRLSVGARLGRLRAKGWHLGQAAIAAGVAYYIAAEVLGHPTPFFAPIAAIVTLGVTLGQRTRRAVEVAVGVTVGIAVADLLVLLIGSGTWQLLVIVMLAMAAAILLGSGTLLVTQAAASAVLVVTLSPPDLHGISFARSLDAAVGCTTALLVGLLLRGWRKGLDAEAGAALPSGVSAEEDLAWWCHRALEAAHRQL